MTLRLRMAAVAGLAVALAVLGLAVGVYVAVRSDLRSEVDQTLAATVSAIGGPLHADARPRGLPGAGAGAGAGGAGSLGSGGPGGYGGRIFPTPAFGGQTVQIQYLSRTGQIRQPPQESSTSVIPVDARALAIAASGRGRESEDTTADGVHVRVLTVGDGSLGALQVARPLTEVDHDLRRVLIVLILAGGAGIVLAVVLGAVVARTALAPIARFTRLTEDLAVAPDLSQRLDVHGRDELARLARSFNATLDALERSADAQRHLVADASHELRTPIASLRANVQILDEADRLPASEREGLRADIISELDELTALVADVVELARGTKPPSGLDAVRVDEIVGAVVERAQRRSEAQHFELALEPTVVSGEGDRISRAVSNLIDNARKWSPVDGVIEATLRDGVLSVRDHGPGFDEQDLPHVFDRFYRADRARGHPGSGLGLAIVRQAAEAHGGFATAANAPGGGALLAVSFGKVLGSEAAESAAGERVGSVDPGAAARSSP
jgi:two-component system sensor histidine kinase MprB